MSKFHVAAHLQFALFCRNSVCLHREEVEGVPDRVLHRLKHLPKLAITLSHFVLNPYLLPLFLEYKRLNRILGSAAKEGI